MQAHSCNGMENKEYLSSILLPLTKLASHISYNYDYHTTDPSPWESLTYAVRLHLKGRPVASGNSKLNRNTARVPADPDLKFTGFAL